MAKKINITITNKLIGEDVLLMCRLVTNNEWHRFLGYDQQLLIHFKSLPL